jgi:hypothetical protein
MNNEPVAWMGIRRHGETRISIEKLANDDIPLYTHPVKELTHEEITQVFDECYPNNGDGDVVTLIDFARAILRKAHERCNGFCGEYECKENQSNCKRKAQNG